MHERLITGPRKPWGVIQQRIIDGISRQLTYRQIGVELAALSRRKKPVSWLTVRAHVVTMCRDLDGLEELRPRERLIVWRKEQSLGR